MTKSKSIYKLNDEDRRLLLDRGKIHPRPNCAERCGPHHSCCMGCADMRAYEDDIRVYREKGLFDLLIDLWRGDAAAEKIAQLEQSIELLKKEQEEANALQKLLEQNQ